MHQTGAMRRCQPRRHGPGDRQRSLQRQRTTRQPRSQRFALVARHGDEIAAVGGLPHLVDGRNVGMVERRCRLGLRQYPLRPALVASDPRSHELERHGTVEVAVARRIHNAHPTAIKLTDDVERPHRGARRQDCFRFQHQVRGRSYACVEQPGTVRIGGNHLTQRLE